VFSEQHHESQSIGKENLPQLQNRETKWQCAGDLLNGPKAQTAPGLILFV